MRSSVNGSAVEKQEHFEQVASVVPSGNAPEVATETVVQFLARHQLIAKEAEDACHLAGNLNSPDFDVFEAKYGCTLFA